MARSSSTPTFGSRTDIGCVRDHNEDSLVVTPPLFAVADGMGGHAAGEVASEIAVNTLAEYAPDHADSEALGFAVVEANRAVIRGVQEGIGREGMGCTMTAAILEGERLVLAQVGDSRAYLLHNANLQQLTRDHSLMADMIEAGQLTAEEARYHPNRSVITRALGSDPHMAADLYELNVEAGDRLLICSDGLTTMLQDDTIKEILMRVKDPQRCASTLVSEANAAGGYDNTTTIVVDVTGHAEMRQKKSARKVKISMVVTLLLLVLVVAGAFFGFRSYANTVAYLANDNGKVAVYRGIPGSLFGIQFNELDHTTDVSVSDLQPGVANRLNDSIRVDNLDAANALVEEYEAEIKEKAATPAGSDAEGSSSATDGTEGRSSSGAAGSSGSAGASGSGTSDGSSANDEGAATR
ncbi:Stp1/IreP family PP2C-type Ser/Thr phosphatase [Raoultibacter phocaeensis]|uniref:Stp1/IreP family PP2C-type Ser/Thr phosphatase n=1 Tax=Raoultibacter phocaeensis TaxID=2479841 RepID=UPI00111A56B8|nr:Stp1/IreP family PP2C-type Ser/Thr phosphatase [Raoultibacter phocaeensis]